MWERLPSKPKSEVPAKREEINIRVNGNARTPINFIGPILLTFFGVLLPNVYQYLALRGWVNVDAARIVLIGGGLAALAGFAWGISGWPNANRKRKIQLFSLVAILLAAGLLGLDVFVSGHPVSLVRQNVPKAAEVCAQVLAILPQLAPKDETGSILIPEPGYAPFNPILGLIEPNEPLRFIVSWKNAGRAEAKRAIGGGRIYLLDREARERTDKAVQLQRDMIAKFTKNFEDSYHKSSSLEYASVYPQQYFQTYLEGPEATPQVLHDLFYRDDTDLPSIRERKVLFGIAAARYKYGDRTIEVRTCRFLSQFSYRMDAPISVTNPIHTTWTNCVDFVTPIEFR
jgi:hypothetical protein